MLTNRVVVVTGATKGIGKSIALEFLKVNAQVIGIYSRDDSAAEKVREGLPENQLKKLTFYRGSIEDVAFLERVFKDIEAKFGKLNILVNNAGINKDSLFMEMTEKVWNSVITTNIKGTLNAALLAAEIMKKSTESSFIINLSSISGIFGRAGQANYACSKGAIIGITKLLAKKYSQYPIFVNAVVPGLIRTDMSKIMTEDKILEITKATILKRIGEPQEIAKVIRALVSGDFSYVSGTCIKVDGGYSR